jgi:hypothetical protein
MTSSNDNPSPSGSALAASNSAEKARQFAQTAELSLQRVLGMAGEISQNLKATQQWVSLTQKHADSSVISASSAQQSLQRIVELLESPQSFKTIGGESILGLGNITFKTVGGLSIFGDGDIPVTGGGGGGSGAGGTPGQFQINSGGLLGGASLYLEGSGIIAMRDSAIAQTFLVYNNSIDSTNYERAKFGWNSNTLEIGSESSGTGAARGIKLFGSSIAIGVAGKMTWTESTSRLALATGVSFLWTSGGSITTSSGAMTLGAAATPWQLTANKSITPINNEAGYFIGGLERGATNLSTFAFLVKGSDAYGSEVTGTYVGGGDLQLRGGNATTGYSGAANGGNVYIDGGQPSSSGSAGDILLGSTRGNVKAGGSFSAGTNLANYVNLTGSAGTSVTIAALGSGTNLDLSLTPKGTGSLTVVTGGGTQFAVTNTAVAVNYLFASGGASGIAPTLTATGTDTDIDVNIITKGAGVLKVNGVAVGSGGGGGGSGTVTNTGGVLTNNAVVIGAGGNDTKVLTGITVSGTSALQLGVAGSTVGSVAFRNATSGSITLQPATGALGSSVLTMPIGTDTLVAIAATQTLTNKTLTSPAINTPTIAGGTHTALTSLGIRSTGTGAFDLTLANTENLNAGRTLTLKVNDAARQLSLSGDLTTAGAFITAGAFSMTLTATAATNVTLPTTGTLATLAGAESLTNKKLGSLTSNGIVTTSGGDGTLSVTAPGTGILAFLVTPSSTNLAAAMTDETGSGALVFGTSPAIGTPTITGGTHTALTNFSLRNAGTGAFDLTIAHNGTLTAGRNLTLNVNDAARTVSLAGDLTLAAAFTTSGANALTLTTSGATNVTLPTTGTLATLAGVESFTNKKLGSLTTNGLVTTSGGDGTLSVTLPAAGILAFLATPSSANLATAVTDETGSGALVFGTAPAIGSPTITTPTVTGGTVSSLTGFSLRNAGTGTFDLTLTHNGTLTAGRTLTLNMNDAARSIGLSGDLTVAAGGATLSGTNTGDQNLFSSIAVSGQTTVTANTTTTGLTLAAGSNVTLTTDNATKTITITSTASGGGGGTVTNTGGALTANALVLGAGTVDTKVVTGITTDGASVLNLGVAGTSVGGVVFANVTSGTVTLQPVAGALGAVTLSLPAVTDTLVGLAAAQSLTNKKLGSLTSNGLVTTSGGDGTLSVTVPATGILAFLATSSSANLAAAMTDETGSGALVFGTSPSLTTPTITGGTLSGITGFALHNSGSGAFDMTEVHNGTLTAGRTLTWNLNDAPRTVSLSGNLTVGSGGASVTGTNTGDQTITLTGDVTGSGTGSFATTIANSAVSLAKMANLAANSIIGNNTGVGATPIALTAAQVKTLLAIANTDVSGLGTMSTQNASGVAVTGGTLAGLTGFALRNAGTGAFDMTETHNGTLTAGRTLTWNLNDVSRTISLSGNLTVSSAATISGTSSGTNTGDQNLFSSVAVSGQTTVTAATTTTSLTLVAGTNIVLTTDNTAKSVTITATGGTGTVTNSGGNLTANALVLGAGLADTKVAAGIVTDGTSKITLGVAGTSVGAVAFANATSGSVTLQPVAGALGAVTLSLPAATGTLALVSGALGTPTSATLTNATGLPVSSGISGLGAGVATALAAAANAAGGFTTIDGSATLTNKTLTSPTINGGTATALTGLAIRSTGTGAFDLTFANTENLTAGRTLTLTLNNAARTISLSGNLTVSSVATISGTNTGDQTITLTGDVTGSGTGSFAATIANSAVTLAKIANIGANTILGNTTAGAAAPVALTAAQTKSLLAIANTDVSGLGTMSTQNASAVAITGGTLAGLTGFALRNAGTGAFDMTQTHNATLTAGRTLTWNLNDAARTISLSGNLTVSSAATISGTNTGDQTITLTGDATGSGTGSFAVTVAKINGTALSGLATGILKNTTTTGVPSIAVAGTDYQAPIGTISGIAKGNGANALTAAVSGTDYVAPGALTSSGLTMSTAKLLGRWSAATGAIQEVTISTGLSLDGSGNLTASASTTVTDSTLSGSTFYPAMSAATSGSITGVTISSPNMSFVPVSGTLTVTNFKTTGLTLLRVNSSAEGGQIDFTRSTDNAIMFSIDAQGSTNGAQLFRFLNTNAGTVLGSFDISGNFTATANVTAYSDERLKKDWADLPLDFIERLAQVKMGTYSRIDNGLRQVGVGAQSLQVLLPEAVLQEKEGDKLSVAYGNAALAACVQLARELVTTKKQVAQELEQVREVRNELEQTLAQMRQELARMKGQQ